jgi:hypothetical protein
MRTLETIVTEQPNANITPIDVAARGARAAAIAIKQTAAPGTGTFTIDDILAISAGNQVFRAAQMYTQTPDANSPDFVLTYLLGSTLQLSNQSGGAVRSIVTLYDQLDIPPQGNYQSFYAASTIAAGGTFTSVTGSTQRCKTWIFTITTNQEFTLNVDVQLDNALTWINIASVAVAAAAGGTATLPVTMSGQTYRLRLVNNDGANILTYTLAGRCLY